MDFQMKRVFYYYYYILLDCDFSALQLLFFKSVVIIFLYVGISLLYALIIYLLFIIS